MYLLGPAARLKGDAALAAASWDGEILPLAAFAADTAELVVDALFGAGLSRDIAGDAAAALGAAQRSGARLVAVDVPSGVDGHTGALRGPVAAADLTIEGEPKVFAVTADSGREVARYFCGACGGHLFTSPWPAATRYSVKAGTLDDPSIFAPEHEIWTDSGVSWLSINAATETFAQGFDRPVDIGG